MLRTVETFFHRNAFEECRPLFCCLTLLKLLDFKFHLRMDLCLALHAVAPVILKPPSATIKFQLHFLHTR